jgi:DNA polymerase-3 subunit epsilon
LIFTALDFETANHKRNSACAIGLVRVEGGEIIEKVCHLIKPPTREFVFTHVHGIRWEDVADQKTFGELWPEIEYLFQGIDFVVAHNAPFDKGVLSACMSLYGITPPPLEFECSMKAAKRKWELPDVKLSTVCKHLGIELKHHEALSDAVACARIVLAAASRSSRHINSSSIGGESNS